MRCKHRWEYQGMHKQRVYPGFANYEYHDIYWCDKCGSIKRIRKNPLGEVVAKEFKRPIETW